MKRFGERVKLAVVRFLACERGSLDQLTTVIGLGVVAALIVVVLALAAPNTVSSLWQQFVGYLQRQFGQFGF